MAIMNIRTTVTNQLVNNWPHGPGLVSHGRASSRYCVAGHNLIPGETAGGLVCVVFPAVRNLLTLSDGLIFFIKIKNRETVYKKLYV